MEKKRGILRSTSMRFQKFAVMNSAQDGFIYSNCLKHCVSWLLLKKINIYTQYQYKRISVQVLLLCFGNIWNYRQLWSCMLLIFFWNFQDVSKFRAEKAPSQMTLVFCFCMTSGLGCGILDPIDALRTYRMYIGSLTIPVSSALNIQEGTSGTNWCSLLFILDVNQSGVHYVGCEVMAFPFCVE